MINLAQLTESDFEKMALEINEISQTKSESELLELIGNALHDSGMTVSTNDSFEIISPKMFDEGIERFSIVKSFNFVADTNALRPTDAKKEGEKLWKRLKDKLRAVICNDPRIKELITESGTLKDFLIAGIPLLLGALGLGVLNPVLLAIIAAIFALILKIGFQEYCEIK